MKLTIPRKMFEHFQAPQDIIEPIFKSVPVIQSPEKFGHVALLDILQHAGLYPAIWALRCLGPVGADLALSMAEWAVEASASEYANAAARRYSDLTRNSTAHMASVYAGVAVAIAATDGAHSPWWDSSSEFEGRALERMASFIQEIES